MLKYFVILVGTLFLAISLEAQELLNNPGFETGDISGWSVVTGNVAVVKMSANALMDPNHPHGGNWMLSASDLDVPNPGDQVRLRQVVSLPAPRSGISTITLSGFVAGSDGPGGSSSDDLVQLELVILNGMTIVGSASTPLIDPELGCWNGLRVSESLVPGADSVQVNINTFLDPGFSSIDIMVDDMSLQLDPGIDSDGDLIADVADNCLDYPNSMQIDADNDGIGNACDPDGAPISPGDCLVNFADLQQLKEVFFGLDPIYDLTGSCGDPDGTVNFADLNRLKDLFLANFESSNPSGVSNICAP